MTQNKNFISRLPLKQQRVLVFLACLLICGGGQGVLINSNSIFVKPVCESLGFSRFDFALYSSIILVISTALYPLLGVLFKKSYFSKLLLLSAVVCGLVPIGFAFSQELWQFYFLASIQGILIDVVSMTLTALIIAGWFEEKQGTVLGIVFAGSGVAAAIMLKFGGWIIANYSWNAAYILMGVISLCMLVPSALLFQCLPLTLSAADTQADTVTGSELNVKSYRSLMTLPQFYLLTIACVLIGFVIQTFSTHIVPYASDIGYSASIQSTMVSLIMLCSVGTKVVIGIIIDKLGLKQAGVVIVLCMFASSLLLLHMLGIPFSYFIIPLTAAFSMSGGPMLSILVGHCFGKSGHIKGYPLMTTMCTLGMAIGSPLPGAIFDHTGSYQLVWYMILLFSLIIGILALSAIILADKQKDLR